MEQPSEAIAAPLGSLAEMEKAAKWAAQSKLFGNITESQAMCLFLLCQAEGVNYIEAIRRYHVIENKPSMRANYMLAKFHANNHAVMWHIRTDQVCAATFFIDKRSVDDATRKRGRDRFDLLWKLNSLDPEDPEVTAVIQQLNELSREGEETIYRTYDDSEEKGLTKSRKWDEATSKWVEKDKVNWKQSPRQMLTARVITEGVNVIAPGILSGIYTPDEVEDIISNERRDEEQFIAKAFDPKARDRAAIQQMIEQYQEEAKTAKQTHKQELYGLIADLRIKLEELDAPDEIPGILPARVDGELPLKGESPRVKVPWEEYILQHVTPKRVRGKKLSDLLPGEIEVLYTQSSYALKEGADVDPQIRTEAEYIREAYEHHHPNQPEQSQGS